MINTKKYNISCNNSTDNEDKCKEIDDSVVQQFKVMVFIVFMILLAFLGFFVYNLIKCYLPKWKREKEMKEGGSVVNIQSSTSQIEFDDKI